MSKLLLSRLSLCVAAALALPAQASIGLTLPAVHAKVQQGSPALQALQHELSAQDGLVQQAGLRPNPELSGLIEDRQSATRTTTILLTQPVELGGKRGARIASAESERSLAHAVVAVKRAELRASASSAFHGLLAAQARQELANTALELARKALSAASSRVASGKNSPLDESRARIAMSETQLELLQARADADNARETLAALWGGSGQEVGLIDARLAMPPALAPLPALLERVNQAPAMRQATLELERRLSLGRLESARRMPDLAVTVGSKREVEAGRRQAVFGVSVPLPLFDRNQGRIAEAMLRSEQARAELAALGATLASQIRMAHTRLELARSQARSLEEEHLPTARSTDAATRKGYEYGKFSLLEVFDAQRRLLQAQAQHLRVLAEAHATAADLERILGTP